MSFWTIDNIKSVLGAAWVARTPTGNSPEVQGVSIDSRSVKPGQAFVAIRGERTDGHLYLADAVTAGASLLIIERIDALPTNLSRPVAVLQVADCAQSLLKLAGAYRRTLDTTRVIAVGGSNGKTTTVRLIHQVLSRTLRGTASPKSFNNAVGVPLTILGAKRTDQFLVCEVGTNAPGEIAPLARVVEPDIAVITSIGREHLEGLATLQGVVQEEVMLLGGLRAGGVAIINGDAPGLLDAARPMVAGLSRQVVTFGENAGADLRITSNEQAPEGVTFTLNARATYRLGLLGKHNAWNAAAAIGVARRLGVANDVIETALGAAAGPPMRLERTPVDEVLFINDAYNANPDSVLAALRTFDEVTGAGTNRRVLVLGDMLELGAAATELHREVGDVICHGHLPDLLVLVGTLSRHTAERVAGKVPRDRVVAVDDLDGPRLGHIASLLRAGDIVLLKGSRRMGLERLIEARKAIRNPGAVTAAASSIATTPSAASTPFPEPRPTRTPVRH